MLDNRLKTVYEMTVPGVLCDIGSDHAKLPVFAVLSNKATLAFACDVREGPLSAARANIAENGVGDKVTPILSDGFLDIPQDVFDSVDCFVLAGMGGELIMNILSGRHTDRHLVLQPQSAVPELCEYLAKNGYRVLRRRYCKQSGKLYTVMSVIYDGKVREPRLFEGSEQSAEFFEYLAAEKKRAQRAIAGINASKVADRSRIADFENIIRQVDEIL